LRWRQSALSACADFDAKRQFLVGHIERVIYNRYKVTIVSVRRLAREEWVDGDGAQSGQAAAAVVGEVAQAHGSRSAIQLIGWSAIRARTLRR
jgi:hypothetical protein